MTTTDCWQVAQEVYPKFAKEEQLLSFSGLIKGSQHVIPQLFREYCQAAIRDAEGLQGDTTHTISKDGSHCTFVQGTFDTVTKHHIQEQNPSFQGAALVLAVCDSEVSRHKMLQYHLYTPAFDHPACKPYGIQTNRLIPDPPSF